MFQKRWLFALALLLPGVQACQPKDVGPDRPWERGEVAAYVPIYDNGGVTKSLSIGAPVSMQVPGKVYRYGTWLLIPDVTAEGIHVLDNSNAAAPVKRYFIHVPGCSDVTVKGNYCYLANYDDLVTIDLSALPAVKETSRLPHAFQQALYPPYTDVYFQCVDTTKGTVIGWRKSTVKNPKCRT